METFLITGGAGFIGSHITEELVKRKQKVIVLDNFSTGKEDNILPFLKEIEVVKGDIRDTAVLKKAMKNVDYVLHQAALRSVPKSIDDPKYFNDVNVSGTLNVLLAAKENKVKRLIFASSSSVYGCVGKLPIKESMCPQPISPYSASKLAGECYCRVFSELYNLPVIILRYFNIFGPRQPLESKYAMAIPRFITCMLQGQSPPVHDDGRQSRDFTYVSNAVKANLLAVKAKNVNRGEIFNIATGERYTVLELIKCLNRILGKNIKPQHIPSRMGDMRHTEADISKAKKMLGYEPVVGFEDGLKKTIAYFRILTQS